MALYLAGRMKRSEWTWLDGKYMYYALVCVLLLFSGCGEQRLELQAVSYQQFHAFVQETGYLTDAERLGWSIVQDDVYTFHVAQGANWKRPDGVLDATDETLPVTQVSYNDAMAYCEWAGERLPTYADYWALIAADKRLVVSNGNQPISGIDQVNVLGNVWELTATITGDSVRLAGGSLFCSEETCHGTSPERSLWVDKQTGNVHIGFAVLKP